MRISDWSSDVCSSDLSKGSGKRIGYALLNLTDTQDVTPRVGRTQLAPSQKMVTLGANGSRTLLYKLVADADDVKDSGIFTQDEIGRASCREGVCPYV